MMSELNKLITNYCSLIRKFSCMFCIDATNRIDNRVPYNCQYCLLPSHLSDNTNNCLSYFIFEGEGRENWSDETIEIIKIVIKMNKE